MHPLPAHEFSTDLTLAFWVKTSALENMDLTRLEYIYQLSLTSAGVVYLPEIMGSSYPSASVPQAVIAAAAWNRLALFKDSTTFKIHVNFANPVPATTKTFVRKLVRAPLPHPLSLWTPSSPLVTAEP